MAVSCMPMDEILELNSGDFDGLKVKDALPLVDFKMYHTDPQFYDHLRKRMAETQTNLVPIQVNGKWLNNGHHRVAIAHELGLAEMQVDSEEMNWSIQNKVI
jgi:hypothetical protein